MSTRATGEIATTIIITLLCLLAGSVVAVLIMDREFTAMIFKVFIAVWFVGLASIAVIISSILIAFRADQQQDRIRESSTEQDDRR